MKTQKVLVPSFRMTQVNKNTNGSTITQRKVEEKNIIAALRAFDSAYSEKEDCVLLFFREKLDTSKETSDYLYAIATLPMKLYNTQKFNFIDVKVHGYKNIPTILINDIKNTFSDVIDRVINKLLLLK